MHSLLLSFDRPQPTRLNIGYFAYKSNHQQHHYKICVITVAVYENQPVHLYIVVSSHKDLFTVYDQSDATATINFSTQYGAATIREQYLYHTRVMYISFSACAGVATIYSEIVAQFSPECGSFSASLIPRQSHAPARNNSPDRDGRFLRCVD